MKFKGRCLTMVLLIAATSFLFISCGIPEYIDFSNLQIRADSSEHSIIVEGTDTSLLNQIQDGPGLVLLYSTNSEALSKFSSICDEFSKKYNSENAGKSSTPLSYDSITGKVGSFSGVELFALKKASDGKFESPFSYCLDLNQLIGQKILIETSGTNLNIQNNSKQNYSSLLWPDPETNKTVYLFAAFSIQGTVNNQFSNVYWSELEYIGALDL